MIENKGTNLQGDRGADWWPRFVRSSGGAGHGGGPVRFEAPLDTRGKQRKEVDNSSIPQSNVSV